MSRAIRRPTLKNPDPSETELMAFRMKCVECGTQLAVAKGKPTHAPYIAADLYKFVMTGNRPADPPGREEKPSASVYPFAK